MLLAVMALALFVAVPVALGVAFADVVIARIVWLGVGALLALSQSRDDELGGVWVVVAAVVAAGLLPVQLGHHLRRRRRP